MQQKKDAALIMQTGILYSQSLKVKTIKFILIQDLKIQNLYL